MTTSLSWTNPRCRFKLSRPLPGRKLRKSSIARYLNYSKMLLSILAKLTGRQSFQRSPKATPRDRIWTVPSFSVAIDLPRQTKRGS